MHHLSRLAVRAAGAVCLVVLATGSVLAGPTVNFTVPAENAMPAVFGSLPWPSDLYFDQGGPTDGDGTLINTGASFGIAADVVRNTNFTAVVERGLDTMDGFGVTTGCFFFFDGPIDTASLPPSPRLAPAPTDSVFLMNLTDGSLVPIALKPNVDTRIANTLSVIPVVGHVLDPQTPYACVVSGAAVGGVTGGGTPVVPSADFVAARTGASANTDANDIYGTAATFVAGNGGPAVGDIAGMAAFTTRSTLESLRRVQVDVLPSLAMPSADFFRPDLVFQGTKALDGVFGPTDHEAIGVMATGWYGSPRFQTNDPATQGNGAGEDIPNTSSLASPCIVACEPADEVFVYTSPTDKTPIIQNPSTTIPFTVVVPNGTPPPNGFPIIINQHGLGGDRKLVADLGNVLARDGFASIGIDAVAHGYRFVDPVGTKRNNAVGNNDKENGFGGKSVPDGFADSTVLTGLPISTISVQLGFFQAFVNIVGVGDNFRQTCADLMQLVRLIQSNSIDGALGVSIDEGNIFYMGHSLGGIMGSCLAAFEPDVKAYLVNATGGGLITQLLLNSSIGAGALGALNTIFTLDPANVTDQYAIFTNLTQSMLDPGDPLAEAGAWTQNPIVGGPRNVLQISDHADEVVPNQANEGVAQAAGLEIFDPFIQNLFETPEQLPVAATPFTVQGNGPGGVTAVYLQQGPATHAATVSPFVGRLSLVPGHAIVAEWPNAFPGYERSVRIQNSFILPNVLAWFRDIVDNGVPGEFSYTTPPDYNPIESTSIPSGPGSHVFFARAVNAGGAASYSEGTPDVVVSFTANDTAGRLSADRSVLGATPLAAGDDLPPGVRLLTSGVLPFFTSVQKEPAGTFSADLTLAYTPEELGPAALEDGSPEEAGLQIARFGGPGTCLIGGAPCANSAACTGATGPCIELLPTTVDTVNNEVTATGLSDFSIFGVVNTAEVVPPISIPGKGKATVECAQELLMVNPDGASVLDKAGNPDLKQSCTDGDTSCDFDATAGQCTFRMALCVNNVDARFPQCPTAQINGVTITKPSEKDAANPAKPGDDLNRAALLSIIDDDGPIVIPTSASNVCAPVDLVVVQKTGGSGFKKTSRTIKLTTLRDAGDPGKNVKDVDVLKLTCLP